MENLNFLKLEFEKFLSFYRSKDVEIDLKPPPLELEELKELGNFKILEHIGNLELDNLLMEKIDLSRNNAMTQEETIYQLQPVKIRYINLEKRRYVEKKYEYRITTILNYAPRIPMRNDLDLKRPKPNFNESIIYNPIMEFAYLTHEVDHQKRGKFHMISPDEPSLLRKPFWTDLYPIPVNPISINVLKEIKSEFLSLPRHNTLEILREVVFEPVKFINYESESEIVKDVCYQRKCIVNYDVLLDDILIDVLQSHKWIIYERVEYFKGLQVFQVSKDRLIVVIELDSLQSKLKLIQQFNNFTIILQVENQKYVQIYSLCLFYCFVDKYLSLIQNLYV